MGNTKSTGLLNKDMVTRMFDEMNEYLDKSNEFDAKVSKELLKF